MKRIICWLLVLLCITAGFSGCNGLNTQTVSLGENVEIPEDGIISASVFETMKKENQAVTFTGESGGLTYEWKIFGNDIKEAKDLNLGIEITRANKERLTFSFLSEEDFGFSPMLTIYMAESWDSLSAIVYGEYGKEPDDFCQAAVAGRENNVLNLSFSKQTGTYEVVQVKVAEETRAPDDDQDGNTKTDTEHPDRSETDSPDTDVPAGNNSSTPNAGTEASSNGNMTASAGSTASVVGNTSSAEQNSSETGKTSSSSVTVPSGGSSSGSNSSPSTDGPKSPSAGNTVSDAGDTAPAGQNSSESVKTPAPSVTTPSGSSSSSGQSDSQSQNQATPAPETTKEPEGPKSYTCTFSIECTTIFNNLNNLEPGKLDVLPRNGIIFGYQSVTFYEGETIYDVLQRICRENGIHLEASFTPMYNSAYVEGIHNLYEFDCGSGSGWMYRVNGWYPNYGCSLYPLKQGDVVEWRYTCDLGKDIGGSNALN